jgi:hypothetical protein
MTDITPNEGTAPSEGHRNGILIGIGALVAVVAFAAAIYLLTRDNGNSTQTAATSTATTSVPTTLPVDTSTAVWPFASSATRRPEDIRDRRPTTSSPTTIQWTVSRTPDPHRGRAGRLRRNG